MLTPHQLWLLFLGWSVSRPLFALGSNKSAFFWALQVQFLLQIIINRIGLLMVSKARATRLKWIVFVIILLVNISVFVIWMPARLQINDRWIRLNAIWDRCEKVIFAVVDGVLNGYFVYLVRSRLIENGLTKYIPLYRMNIGLIGLSLSLDVRNPRSRGFGPLTHSDRSFWWDLCRCQAAWCRY
jgi:hypothetical protein